MKQTQGVSAGIALILAISFITQAQGTNGLVQSKPSVQTDDLNIMLEAVEAATLPPGKFVPKAGNFDSAALGHSQSSMPTQVMGIESSDMDDSSTYSFPTNGLWLEITNISNGWSYLNLHNATDQVYAIWSTTNLLANWNVETEVWPTNPPVISFMVPTLERQNLFLQAEDWTGVTENGNTTPDWWFWKYFGTVALTDSDLDSQGKTLLYDYQNGLDPNTVLLPPLITQQGSISGSLSFDVQS